MYQIILDIQDILPYRWGKYIISDGYRVPLTFFSYYNLTTGHNELSFDLPVESISRKQCLDDLFWLITKTNVSLLYHADDVTCLYKREISSFLRSAMRHWPPSNFPTSTSSDPSYFLLGMICHNINTKLLSTFKYESFMHTSYETFACAKTSNSISAHQSHVDHKPISGKLPSCRSGKPASQSSIEKLLKDSLYKYRTGFSYGEFPLFVRRLPTAGGIASIEAAIVCNRDILLYNSEDGQLSKVNAHPLDIEILISDIWLNTGSISSSELTAILLFIKAEPLATKYQSLSHRLGHAESGLILSSLWDNLADSCLSGCIIGNPASILLCKYLNGKTTYLPSLGLVLFKK